MLTSPLLPIRGRRRGEVSTRIRKNIFFLIIELVKKNVLKFVYSITTNFGTLEHNAFKYKDLNIYRVYTTMAIKKRARRTYRRKARKSLRKQMYQVAKNVYNKKVEWKFNDIVASSSITTSTSINLINGIIEGPGRSERDGAQINNKSIYLRGEVRNASNVTRVIRMMIVIDKTPREGTMTMGDLYDFTAPGATFYQNTAPRKAKYMRRFVILADRRFILSPQDTDSKSVYNIKVFKKLFGKTQYDADDTGTSADITHNAIYIVWQSDASTPDDVLQNTLLRFRYTE